MKYVRRFVFVHFDDLLELRFKQLEKVTDKLYVFVPSSVEHVPLALVRQMQKMGPDLDWIELADLSPAATLAMVGFHVGVLHEKIDLGVEFAILSDDASLDALVRSIDEGGRTCVRVKQRSPRSAAGATPPGEHARAEDADGDAVEDLDRDADAPRSAQEARSNGREDEHGGKLTREDIDELLGQDFEDLDAEGDEADGTQGKSATSRLAELPEGFGDYQAFVTTKSSANNGNGRRQPLARPDASRGGSAAAAVTAAAAEFDPKPLADDLVRRLIRSGNRPADLSMLRSYILLHTEDARAARNVDAIIEQMASNGEVRVKGDAVAYSF